MSPPDSTPTADSTFGAIARYNEGREPRLVRIKYRRMGRDVFAFFRGTDHLFAAAWPALQPVDPGPDLLICGDLHLENLGGYRAEGGGLAFDLNDFDEALVAPCSFDLVRCSTSILLAAQVWGLSPIGAIRTALGYLDRYRETIVAESDGGGLKSGGYGPIRGLLGDGALATQAELLRAYTRPDKSGVRSIRRSKERCPGAGKREAAAVAGAIEGYGERIGHPDAFRVLDVTGRVAGIGSLGVRRFVALVEGAGSPDGNRLLDLKAAAPPALLGCTRAPQPGSWTSQARRVVESQRRLQGEPAAGLDVIALGGEEFRLRELIPEENRTTLDRFRRRPAKLRRAVEVAGRLTARAQLRGARLDDRADRTADLARWAASPALDAVLASAVRYAEKTRQDFWAFRKAIG